MYLSAFMIVTPLPSIAGVPLVAEATAVPIPFSPERGESGGCDLEYFGRSTFLTLGTDANTAMEDVAAHPSTTHIGGTFTVVPMTIPAATREAVGAACAQSNSTSICSRFFASKRAVESAIFEGLELLPCAACTTCRTRGVTRDCQSKADDPGVAAIPT